MSIDLELFIAASEGNTDSVLRYIKHGGDLETLGGADDQTPLIAAAAAGHEATVRALLTAGAQIAAQDGEGNSALRLAAWSGWSEVVLTLLEAGALLHESGCREILHAIQHGDVVMAKALLDAGAVVNAREGHTPLSAAAATGQLTLVDLLVEHGADLNAPGERGRSPLFWANEGNHTSVIIFLKERGAIDQVSIEDVVTDGTPADLEACLAAGASVNDRSVWGGSPLLKAVIFHRVEMVEALLLAGANPNLGNKKGGGRPLHEAAAHEQGHTLASSFAIVDALINAKANIDQRDGGGRTPLWWAVHRRCAPMVEHLLAKGASVGVPRPKRGSVRRSLVCAIEQEDDAMLNLLLAVPTPKKQKAKEGLAEALGDALHVACARGDLPLVDRLLEAGAAVDFLEYPMELDSVPLMKAVYGGHLAITERILAAGACMISGVLHQACYSETENEEELVLLIIALIEAGADINEYSEHSRTPLSIAACANRELVVRTLLKRGANPTLEAFHGALGLDYAWNNQGCNSAIVEQLLSAGFDPCTVDEQGQNMLHCSVQRGKLDAVTLLIGLGLDPDSPDVKGLTARALAETKGNALIIAALK